jgi:hypothetical protein
VVVAGSGRDVSRLQQIQRNSVRPRNNFVVSTGPKRSVVEGPAVLFASTNNSHLSHPSCLVIPSEAEGSAVRPAALSNTSWKASRRNHPLRIYPNPVSQCPIAALIGLIKSTPDNRPFSQSGQLWF